MTAENPLNHLLQAYVEASLPILTQHPLPLTQDWQGTIDPGGPGFSALTVSVPDYWSHVTRVEPHLIDLPETDALLQAIRRDDQLQSVPPTFQPSTYDDHTERTRGASLHRRDGGDRRGDRIHGEA